MCFLAKAKSIEEIVAQNSIGMSDEQKAAYWFELSQSVFALLGKVDVPIIEITVEEWIKVAQAQYPALTDIKLADDKFYTTTIEDLAKILTLDWTNLVKYQPNLSDCDKFAARLYSHLVDYYGITAIIPVWGDTTAGYHGFELGVVQSTGQDAQGKLGPVFIARLIEPQRDTIFVNEGPLGTYTPKQTVLELGIKNLLQGR